MLNRNFILLAFITSTLVGFSQELSSSPYSSYGIGEEGSAFNGQFDAIGGVTSAVIDTATLNFFNPSSYANLSKGQPLFSTTVGWSRSKFASSGQTTSNGYGGLGHLAFAFPIKNRFGLAFGLNTVSRRGYATSDYSYVLDDTVSHRYYGSGSTQRIFGGLSVNVINTPSFKWGVGANLGFVFGAVTNYRSAAFFDDDGAGGVDQTAININSAQYDFGTFIEKSFEGKFYQKFTVGATFKPQQRWTASQDYNLYYADDVTDFSTYDTIQQVLNTAGAVEMPSALKLGLRYTIQPSLGSEKKHGNYRLNVYGEYAETAWSQYKEEFNGVVSTPNYNNASRMSFGVDFTPNLPGNSKSIKKFNLSQLVYKAGFYNQTLCYQINGVSFNEKAISLGLQIPLSNSKSNSSFTLSAVAGQRSSTQTDFQHQFISINAGIIIAPMFYDRWFRKYKLD